MNLSAEHALTPNPYAANIFKKNVSIRRARPTSAQLALILAVACTCFLIAPSEAIAAQHAKPVASEKMRVKTQQSEVAWRGPAYPVTIEQAKRGEAFLRSLLPKTTEVNKQGKQNVLSLSDISIEPVKKMTERQVDEVVTKTMPTNDIDLLDQTQKFDTTSGPQELRLAKVVFEVAQRANIPGVPESEGPPCSYTATLTYRGTETYDAIAHYNIYGTYTGPVTSARGTSRELTTKTSPRANVVRGTSSAFAQFDDGLANTEPASTATKVTECRVPDTGTAHLVARTKDPEATEVDKDTPISTRDSKKSSVLTPRNRSMLLALLAIASVGILACAYGIMRAAAKRGSKAKFEGGTR